MNEYKEKEWLEQKYWGEGLSTYKISSICSTCPSQIFRWLQKHGIRTRSRSEAEMGKRNHMHCKTGERNPFYGEHHSQEARKKMSEAVRKWYEEHPNAEKGENNPMYGKKRSEEAKRKTSQHLKGRIFTKQHRERQSEAAKGRELSEETKHKLSEFRTGKSWEDLYGEEKANEMKERYAEIYTGEGNPFWKGGTSFEPYSPEFNEELKERIRQRDGYICQLCGLSNEDSLRKWGKELVYA